jgi:hypothetical protein
MTVRELKERLSQMDDSKGVGVFLETNGGEKIFDVIDLATGTRFNVKNGEAYQCVFMVV